MGREDQRGNEKRGIGGAFLDQFPKKKRPLPSQQRHCLKDERRRQRSKERKQKQDKKKSHKPKANQHKITPNHTNKTNNNKPKQKRKRKQLTQFNQRSQTFPPKKLASSEVMTSSPLTQNLPLNIDPKGQKKRHSSLLFSI